MIVEKKDLKYIYQKIRQFEYKYKDGAFDSKDIELFISSMKYYLECIMGDNKNK